MCILMDWYMLISCVRLLRVENEGSCSFDVFVLSIHNSSLSLILWYSIFSCLVLKLCNLRDTYVTPSQTREQTGEKNCKENIYFISEPIDQIGSGGGRRKTLTSRKLVRSLNRAKERTCIIISSGKSVIVLLPNSPCTPHRKVLVDGAWKCCKGYSPL